VQLRTGYVEAVATAEHRRGRGIAGAVLAEVERLVTGGFELGALSASEEGAALYTARSWTRWSGPIAALTPGGVVDCPGELVFARRTPHTPRRVDSSAPLVCDWRRGDLW